MDDKSLLSEPKWENKSPDAVISDMKDMGKLIEEQANDKRYMACSSCERGMKMPVCLSCLPTIDGGTNYIKANLV